MGFRNSDIFSQNNSSFNSLGEQRTGVSSLLSNLTTYDLKVSGGNYTLTTGATSLLSGLLRSNFWLSAIAVGLAIIQLDLIWKFIGTIDALTLRGLFLTDILYLIWKKKHILNLKSYLFSTLIGLFLISFILVKSLSLFWFEYFFIKIFALFSLLLLLQFWIWRVTDWTR